MAMSLLFPSVLSFPLLASKLPVFLQEQVKKKGSRCVLLVHPFADIQLKHLKKKLIFLAPALFVSTYIHNRHQQRYYKKKMSD